MGNFYLYQSNIFYIIIIIFFFFAFPVIWDRFPFQQLPPTQSEIHDEGLIGKWESMPEIANSP